jgi:hypothetical protein
MVHCLEILKILNDPKNDRKTPDIKPKVPDRIALYPLLARRYTNRAWSKEELEPRKEEKPFENKALGIENRLH